jgi:hypothetical protein
MIDSYYELVDANDALGEKFKPTDLVRSTWPAAIQHAAPVSALPVRALQCCAFRDDTRLSRVAVDLHESVPVAEGLGVGARIDRSGKQIELLSVEMLARGPDGAPRPVARASGWRLHQIDTQDLAHAPAPPLGPTLFDETAAVGSIQQSVLVRHRG